ncbi:endoplasmic reticulum protein [Auriculariales sp. MPI-PUGE-AT-0066]|nr:endoplasmic reticulum protein [Auriculariales sp. MPI-PUGE-AT-0066]
MLSLVARSAARTLRTVTPRAASRALPVSIVHQAGFSVSLRRFDSSNVNTDELGKQRERQQADWVAPIVTFERVKELTEQPTENIFLIDVREPDEVAQGAIPSAVSIPLSGFTQSISLSESAFLDKHGFNKPKLDNQVIFYCRSGKRSASATDIARRNGYTNIHNYEGSWLDWASRHGIPAS